MLVLLHCLVVDLSAWLQRRLARKWRQNITRKLHRRRGWDWQGSAGGGGGGGGGLGGWVGWLGGGWGGVGGGGGGWGMEGGTGECAGRGQGVLGQAKAVFWWGGTSQ